MAQKYETARIIIAAIHLKGLSRLIEADALLDADLSVLAAIEILIF